MAIEIEVTCKTCGRTWAPSHRDYVAGVWAICPACRPDPDDATPDTTRQDTDQEDTRS